ncbi:RHS repeat-associated core domain-containing protein [Bacteroides sp. OttesenSCG-928-N06]|nr:RHS repeat-associated core domain-containing protein [Bacteroides sp. OttesenSCG-928-N06]
MKRKIVLILMLLGVVCASGQNNNNYVRTITPTVSSTTVSGLTVNNSITTYQYLDGLGRAQQTVQVGVTPGKADIVTYQEYDVFGRESNSWLPIPTATTTNKGLPVTLATLQTRSASVYADSKAYSKPVYETSPLNRILEQYGPGQNWHNNAKSVKTEYLTNSTSYPCRWFRTTDNRSAVQLSVTSGKTTYAPGELYVTRTTDENNQGVTLEFTNKLGQTILTRQMNGTTSQDTYYVYDCFNNLRAVLPPLAADALTANDVNWTDATTAIAQYAYLYKYDNRNRMIGKKLPGANWCTYVYDKADRLIFSQDGEQANKTPKEWTFYLYDKFGRQVLQGTCTNTNTANVANMVVITTFVASDIGIGSSGYTSSFGITSPTLHQVNYYDNYSFRAITGFNNANFPSTTVSAKGLLTGSITTILDSSTKLYSANYYDIRGRLINTVSSNNMGGYDKTTTVYTFTGKPKTVTHVHTASGKATQTQVYTYTYDHAERLKTLTHKLNADTVVTLTNNSYDELGRLNRTICNESTSLIDNYTYNIRSWIVGIRGPQINYDLTYNDNGNIATMQWNTNSQTRKYTYNYDALSRLTSAAYNGATTTEKYNTAYTYDKHGNIKTLQRYGKTTSSAYGLVDNLTMNYTGNQLTNVADAGTTVSLAESNDFKKGSTTNPGYAYNKNGAMTKDLNKKITNISYNSLNLPKQLVINGATHTYTYAADGRKLKVTQGNTNRDYAGSIIYENGSLKRILVEGGYIEGGVYYFYLNDHLGNTRVMANASGTAIQRDHYYPFGLPMAETSNTEQNKQPYKYNGKEFERKDGLNWMDYGARNYDAAIGRFTTMDPLAEKYYSVSPYAYVMNNPMNAIDPDGRDIIVLHNPKGAMGAGHSAILVGDDKKGWQYVSKDGTALGVAGPSRVGEDKFDTVDKFDKSDYAKNNNGYPSRVRFSTTSEQDAIAHKTMLDHANKWYWLIGSNCVDAVSAALQAAGLNPGYAYMGINNPFADPITDKSLLPNNRFEKMIKNNSSDVVDQTVNANPKVREEQKGTTWNDFMNFLREVITYNPSVNIRFK